MSSAISNKIRNGVLQLLGMSFFACGSDSTRGPQITGLDPQRVLQGQGISATISGRNFLTQVHVTLDSKSAPKESRVFSVWLGSNGLPPDAVSYFLTNAESAVAQIRGYGYQVPLLVLSNNYGYDLPTALDSGLQILAADPLHNTLLEWAAFWGTNNYYQGLYGMSLTAGVAAAAAAPFPINIAVTQFAQTAPTISIDYKSVITAAQISGVGWLWSQWYDPNFVKDELTADGTYAGLNSLGTQVVVTNSGGLSYTTSFACGR